MAIKFKHQDVNHFCMTDGMFQTFYKNNRLFNI